MRVQGSRNYRSQAFRVMRMAAIGSLLASARAADAQTAVDPRMERDTVGARSRPGYEPVPIRFGTLTFAPVLAIDTTVTDNLYARSDVKVHDAGLVVHPAAVVTTQGPHHTLSLQADAQLSRWADHRTENTNAYGLSGDGRVDLAAHTSLGAELSQARLVEPRGTTGDTLFGAKPITYDRTIAGLTLAQDFGLTRVQLGARYQRFAYQNRTLDGSTIDLSGRDYEMTSASARVLRGLSPGVAGYIDLALSHSRYPHPLADGVDRNSNGTTALAGLAFGLNRLLQGEVGLGYIAQQFHDARFPAIHALAYNAALAWSPTRLTTVHVRAARSFQRSPIAGIAGIREDTFALAAEHELLRNVILRPALSYTRSAFRGGERRDTYVTAQFGTTWLVNTHWQVDLNLAHALGRNNVPTSRAREYDTNRAALSLRYRF